MVRPRVRTWFRVADKDGVVVNVRLVWVGRRKVGWRGVVRLGVLVRVRRRRAWRRFEEGVGGMAEVVVVVVRLWFECCL